MSRPFDVFVSHSSVDKPWVRGLIRGLQRYEVKVWLDEEQIRPGARIVDALEDGIEASRAMCLIVSPESMSSGWVREEYSRAMALAHRRESPLQLIPVLLRDATLPGFLGNRSWVDFRAGRAAYAESLWRLVWGITGHKPERIDDVELPGDQDAMAARAATAEAATARATAIGAPDTRGGSASAAGAAAVELTRERQDKLVKCLEVCGSLQDLAQRRAVIGRLDGEIRTRIAELSAMRPHLSEMVKICAAFPEGLRQLRGAVHWYEGDTHAMSNFDKLLAKFGVAIEA